MAFLETATKCLKSPHDRIQLVEDSSKFDPSTIRDGVVIFFAAWSAPAHMALESFTERLSEIRSEVPVWILNVDTLTTSVDEKFGGAKHGYGETFFFRGSVQMDQLLSLEGNYGENSRTKLTKVFGDT